MDTQFGQYPAKHPGFTRINPPSDYGRCLREAEKSRGRAVIRNKVLLVSGLPLKKDTSFKRQLELLGKFLTKRGIEHILLGPDPDIETAICQNTADAAILLGYHDQFPFLNSRTGIPLWLWAQLSRPIDSRCLGEAIPVPLTPLTKKYLIQSGVENIGPVIPHGVDTDIYLPLDGEKKEKLRMQYGIGEEFVIGTVAANSSRKRLDRIIESFSIFASSAQRTLLFIKTDRVKGVDGTDLLMLSERYGVRGKVVIIEESFGENRMAEVYNLMDLYLTLSEWEGFCIPIIEAMACGVPIATHEVQGPGELVPYDDLLVKGSTGVFEGETRLLLADSKQAALVLLRAYEEIGILPALGEIGRMEVLQKYDMRVVSNMWESLVQQ